VSLWAFDEPTAFEASSGPHESDQVGRVHGPPAGLGGLDQLVGRIVLAARC